MKEPKTDVDYSKGMLHSHCGMMFHDDKYYCEHFRTKKPGPAYMGSCELVEGMIGPSYWCKLYERKK